MINLDAICLLIDSSMVVVPPKQQCQEQQVLKQYDPLNTQVFQFISLNVVDSIRNSEIKRFSTVVSRNNQVSS